MLLAPFVLQAERPAAFAPPLGVPIRVVTERIETAGAARRTYRTERLVRFSRDGIGYRAEVVVLGGAVDPPDAAAAMFEAGLTGLTGGTMTLRLDGAGKVVSVDDREKLWDAFCRGVVTQVLARGKHASAVDLGTLAERISAPLRALPADRQLAMFASLVNPLIAEEGGEAPGTRAVRLPGTSPFGGPVTLTGTRMIAADGALMRILTRAAADVTLPARADAPARAGRVEIEIARDFDPRTGLLASGIETVRMGIEGVQQPDRVTRVRAEPAPETAWPK